MGSKLIDRLDAEWEWLSRSRKGARALRRWADTDEELRDFGDLAELVAFVHRRDRVCEADRILFRLVCRASTDDLAARTCWCRELVHARFRGDSGQLADYEST